MMAVRQTGVAPVQPPPLPSHSDAIIITASRGGSRGASSGTRWGRESVAMKPRASKLHTKPKETWWRKGWVDHPERTSFLPQ